MGTEHQCSGQPFKEHQMTSYRVLTKNVRNSNASLILWSFEVQIVTQNIVSETLKSHELWLDSA